MEWDTIVKVVETGNTILILALILFGGGTGERALWVYGWIYRALMEELKRSRDETKAARAETERWQRAWMRLAGSLDKALDKAGMPPALAEIATTKGRLGDVNQDD